MKKSIQSLLAIATIATSAFAQTIPNSGFETWTANTSPAYNTPDGWGTMNNKTAANSSYTVTKGTPGSPGTAYLKLTSKTINGSVVNGVAFSGKIDSMNVKPISGFAYNLRPQTFTGKYQHMIYGSSQGSIKVYLTKWNTATNKRDTIASALKTLSGMVMAPTWASYSLTFVYKIDTDYPDSCVIELRASGSSPTASDFLYADNLAFAGTVAVVVVTPNTNGIKANPAVVSNLELYPNPTNGTLNIKLDLKATQQISIEIIDVTGKLIQSNNLGELNGESTKKVNITGISKGIYFVKISGEDFSETRKIIVE